jgi:uncharacterized delta-60 repeat protein
VRGKLGIPFDVAIDPDGKIVTAGSWTPFTQMTTNSFLQRFNSNGSDDNTFITTPPPPSSIFTFDAGGNDGINAIALQPDGGIITAGGVDGDSKDAVVERIIPGSAGLDSNFGASGKRTYGLGTGSYDEARAVVVEPGGKIDVAGYGRPAASFTLTRLTASGALDNSLNGNSTVDADFGGDDVPLAIALMGGGKILLAGADDHDMALARFQPGGLPDTTFGPAGKATVSFAGLSYAGANAMAIQPDGKIVLAGGGQGGVGLVARLQGDSATAGGGGGGGGSTKVPRCLGKKATIVGTNGKNRLKGTKRADVIVALGGNDTISSLGGNDVVCGGNGNDKISLSSGNDKASGGNGNDKVSGGNGNDKLSGDAGKDSISGDAGNDTESGGSGNDKLGGGSGKDKLSGGSGKDALNGGSGKDKCAGRDRKKSC